MEQQTPTPHPRVIFPHPHPWRGGGGEGGVIFRPFCPRLQPQCKPRNTDGEEDKSVDVIALNKKSGCLIEIS